MNKPKLKKYTMTKLINEAYLYEVFLVNSQLKARIEWLIDYLEEGIVVMLDDIEKTDNKEAIHIINQCLNVKKYDIISIKEAFKEILEDSE